MMNPTAVSLARLAPMLALFSCAAPKAIVVEKAKPPEPPKEIAARPKVSEEPAVQPLPDNGIRLPDMMTMPGDDEFRVANRSQSNPGTSSGAVIARPPTDPPPRPKPE